MADLVLRNGRIFTGDPTRPWAEAISVRDGLVVAVGSNREAEAWAATPAGMIDLQNQLVLPGFNDAHVHMLDGGLDLLGIRLRDCRDEVEFASRVRTYAAALPAGEWVTGGNWDHENWPSHRFPHRRLIDPFTAAIPVFVQRLDGHVALANGRALELAGINRHTPDPQGGWIERDPRSGEPTGILKDTAMDAVQAVIPALGPARHEQALRAALDHAASLGVTSVQDNSSAADLEAYRRLLRRGELKVRVNAWRSAEFRHDLARIGVRPPFGDPWLRLGTVKLFADGSMGAGSALFFAPYEDDPGTSGLAIHTEPELRRIVVEADRDGLQVAVHAIGDKANALVLDALAAAAQANGRRDARHRIEHAQVVRAADVARFRELGVVASVQPSHCIDDMRWAEKRIGERVKDAYRWRSFLEAGVPVAFGTDWFVEPLDPMIGLYAAVTREFREGGPAGGWRPTEKLTLAQAISCYTLGSAYAEFQEERKGTLAPGKHADLVVLDRDLFAIPPAEILKARVVLTMVGGKTVYKR